MLVGILLSYGVPLCWVAAVKEMVQNIGGSLELIIRNVAAGPWHTKEKNRPGVELRQGHEAFPRDFLESIPECILKAHACLVAGKEDGAFTDWRLHDAIPRFAVEDTETTKMVRHYGHLAIILKRDRKNTTQATVCH
jgi:hypothetical protein